METKEDSETLALLSGPIKEASNILQELINIHIDGKVILAIQGQVKDDKPTFIERTAVKSICGVFENLLTTQVGIPNEQLLQVIYVLFLKLCAVQSLKTTGPLSFESPVLYFLGRVACKKHLTRYLAL
ncbi:uncharacterized protein [Coffea arabica]|uniref:Uncharacterized protein n=1 Tax=Coffea arabica TaxID=13443 RepID=A0ABM4UQB3_COFAR